eukprot:4178668-Amphidinium_carterae.1
MSIGKADTSLLTSFHGDRESRYLANSVHAAEVEAVRQAVLATRGAVRLVIDNRQHLVQLATSGMA